MRHPEKPECHLSFIRETTRAFVPASWGTKREFRGTKQGFACSYAEGDGRSVADGDLSELSLFGPLRVPYLV